MKKEDLDGLKQAMDPLNRGGAVVLPLMAALALPTLLREREQLLAAAKRAMWVGEIHFRTCALSADVHDALAAAIAAAES